MKYENLAICQKCWKKKHPGRAPVTVSDPRFEPCYVCGISNNSGIYVRTGVDDRTFVLEIEAGPFTEVGVEKSIAQMLRKISKEIEKQGAGPRRIYWADQAVGTYGWMEE